MSTAYTRITDIVVPEVFVPYMLERTATLSALVRSGIVVPDPALDELAQRGGKLINMPFFQDLTSATDEIIGGNTASSLSVQKIGTSTDIAVLFMRGAAFGANDLAAALSGDDPMGAIADLMAAFWDRREQALLIQILTGVFNDNIDNDSSDLVSDVAIEDGNAATDAMKMGPDVITDAQFLLGDASQKLTAIAMHSTPFSRLVKQKLIDYVFDQDVSMRIPTYMDKTVIVDDSLPTTAGTTSGTKYTSYLFGRGAIGRGEGNAPVPVETDRDSLAGDDVLINRRHFLLHPRGVKFTSTSVAESSPTNAEAAQASNWDRVYEKKNIRLVKLVTNG